MYGIMIGGSVVDTFFGTDNSGIYLIMAQFVIVALVTGILSFAAPHSKFYSMLITYDLGGVVEGEAKGRQSADSNNSNPHHNSRRSFDSNRCFYRVWSRLYRRSDSPSCWILRSLQRETKPLQNLVSSRFPLPSIPRRRREIYYRPFSNFFLSLLLSSSCSTVLELMLD